VEQKFVSIYPFQLFTSEQMRKSEITLISDRQNHSLRFAEMVCPAAFCVPKEDLQAAQQPTDKIATNQQSGPFKNLIGDITYSH
jgi:hypothetical protein